MALRSVWETTNIPEVTAFSGGYKSFLGRCKTERECASFFVDSLTEAGFRNLEACVKAGERLMPGDRVFYSRSGKAVAAFIIGRRGLHDGVHFVAAHLDSPRLDIRMNPFNERDDFVQLRTYYYGGIKKYQWVTQPLSLHGVIIDKNGRRVDVAMGDDQDDPVFYISDLPNHLSAQQLEKPMKDAINGEQLLLIAGSVKAAVTSKGAVLGILLEKYGIVEEDFISAELEAVPAGKPRDVGFDRGMISAYGHDDRACAYAAFEAFSCVIEPEYTTGLMLLDKEEVGSQATTGMNSHFMEYTMDKLTELTGCGEGVEDVFLRSKLLSADVCFGYDPVYPEAFEESNTPHLGCGPVLVKYAGHGGKKNANDASAEFVGYLRSVFEDAQITWQIGEMGKIDFGGGSTIAPFSAKYGIETADFGIALLSMHAPYELASKADLFEMYRAYKAFYGDKR